MTRPDPTTNDNTAQANRYLQVNIYPGSNRWHVVAMVKQAGRPFPRLLRTVFAAPLNPTTHDLPSALHAAAERLEQLSRELSQETGP